MKKIISFILIFSSLGCATNPRKRFLLGSGMGAASGATIGSALSPNSESRNMNAIVWGLTGAVLGGMIGLFLRDDGEVSKPEGDLEVKEEAHKRKVFTVPSNQELPIFVKERIQPAILEEYTEEASIAEDGTLREPHKVWRIKRPTELNAKPLGGAK